jgi:hypothetical protein
LTASRREPATTLFKMGARQASKHLRYFFSTRTRSDNTPASAPWLRSSSAVRVCSS